MANFDRVMKVIFKNEGGFSNARHDPGHATNFGITQDTLSRYLGKTASVAQVRNLKKETAALIYKRRYWNVMDLDHVNDDTLATAIMDQAVLQGTNTAIIFLQKSLKIKADGQMGPKTIVATNEWIREKKSKELIKLFLDRALARLQSLDGWRHFHKNWSLRIAGLAVLSGVKIT